MLISLSNLKKRIRSSNEYPQIVLLTLSVAHFLDDGLVRGFSTLLPFIKDELNLSYLDVSLVGSTRSAINAIGNPLMGWISDKTGKRKLLFILGILGFYIGTVAIGLIWSFTSLLLILSFAQLASTIYHPQATSILNYSFKERLHSAIGIHGALGAVGLMIFPILLSKSSDLFGWRISPTLVYTPFVVIVIILIPLVVRDTEKTDKTRFNLGLIRKNWLPISMLSLYSGLHTMAFLNNSLFLPLYLSSIKNFDIVQIGLWIGISGIGNILGQAIIGFGAEKFRTRKLILVTSILYGVFFYGFLSINNDLFQLLLLILFSSVNAASFPLVMSITTEIVNKESVTVTMGIIQSITGITRVVISPIMGYLADEVGLVFTMTLALIPVTLGGFVALWIKELEN